ncbi:MAG: DUF5360 family protein [Myxococcales bacterium]
MRFVPLSRPLRFFMLGVDLGFIVYWVITLTHVLPAEWLYAHHDDPVMVAWNWSFLPLDLFVSATGLSAVAAARRGDARWVLLAMLSLAATSASGMNAIAFWALRGDFDLGWWAPNLALLLGPLPFAWRLWDSARPDTANDAIALRSAGTH